MGNDAKEGAGAEAEKYGEKGPENYGSNVKEP